MDDNRPTLWSKTAYGAFWVGCNGVFRPYFRFSVENRPRLPGGFVLVSNHVSFLDPILLGAALFRRCRYMMTEIYYRDPKWQWFYRLFRAIPVAQRGGNRDAIRAARDALARGEIVGIFPEGGLSRDGGLYLGSPGAVSLVLAEAVPVVPAAIVGADAALPLEAAWPRPRRITVRFGAPIPAEELSAAGGHRKARLTAATERIMRAIAALGGQVAREDELRELRARRAAQKA